MWKTIFGALGLSNLLWILSGTAVVLSATYLSGCTVGESKEHLKSEVRLNAYREAVETTQRDVAAQNAKDLENALNAGKQIKEDYETQVEVEADAGKRALAELGRAREQLRLASAAGRQLAPAASAPAACGAYEADRTRLPQADDQFLIDFAVGADNAAIRLDGCQSELKMIYDLYGH